MILHCSKSGVFVLRPPNPLMLCDIFVGLLIAQRHSQFSRHLPVRERQNEFLICPDWYSSLTYFVLIVTVPVSRHRYGESFKMTPATYRLGTIHEQSLLDIYRTAQGITLSFTVLLQQVQ